MTSFITPPSLTKQTKLRHDIMKQTLFVLPDNDGEARRSLEILKAAQAPWIHKSTQGWGAVLDKEYLEPALLNKVKTVLTFELPAKAPQRGELCCEERLKLQGINLKIIDHHRYGWVDRSSHLSSIEQLCAYIGWEMDYVDLGIATNDRSYIGGLVTAQYTTEEILAIRHYDLEAQGHSLQEIKTLRQKARDWIADHSAQGPLWTLENLSIDKKWVLQELALNSDYGWVDALEKQPHKMSFSGSPKVVEQLNRIRPKDFGYSGKFVCYSGGDAQHSQYWVLRGMRPLGRELIGKITETVHTILKDQT